LDATPGERSLPAIGLQLYTIRQLMVLDMASALTAVADAGYTEVEFAGYFDKSPEQVRGLVEQSGLDPVGSHVSIELLRDDAAAVIATAQTVGHRYLIVPYLPEPERTIEGFQRLAADLNTIGRQCQDAGITIGYHNHDFEFAPLDGTKGYDVLLEETDPDVVTFELDFYWMAQAGGDIMTYLDSNPGRFRLCHVKDRGPVGQMMDVGIGTLLWPQYFHRAKAAGLQHFLVEHDTPEDPLQSIQRSHLYLDQLRF
jgi:sugar phosphate isomerase/epimerase